MGDGGMRLSDVDEWGRSEHLRSILRQVFDPIYRHWFRAEWEGLDKIPAEGGALLVSNHAGAVPPDAAVIMHGIEVHTGRPVYGLGEHLFKTLPYIGTLWSRLGGVPADPDNAYRLLANEGQLVVTFPEGVRGPGKTFDQRYRLRQFGRGGFVEVAMRAGVPVVPVAVLGAEEAMPMLADLPELARRLGLPYVPLTLNHILFGPFGTFLWLPAKFRLRVLDPVHFDVPPHQDSYPVNHVKERAGEIRDRLQASLDEMLARRQSILFG